MGTTGLETAFAALYTELVLAGRARAGDADRADDRRRRAVRPADAADRVAASRPTSRSSTSTRRWEVGADGYASRSANCCFHGRTLHGRVRADDRRRRASPFRRADSPRRTARRAAWPMSRPMPTAYVLLEDGARFDGIACGADGHAVGEIVFTTSMSGYQEAMTDPSYAGQLITFTYPQIGNYGVIERGDGVRPDPRPRGDHARRQSTATTRPAPRRLADVADRLRDPGDHRPRHPRARPPHPRRGRDARRAVPGASTSEPQARELIDAEPAMTGRDLARDGDPGRAGHARADDGPADDRDRDDRHRRQAVDRREPPRPRRDGRAAPVHRRPHRSCCANDPDAIFLANGPGDPAALDYIVQPSASWSASCRCTGSASATSCCAGRSAWTPTSSRSATTAPTTRSRT